MSDLTNIVKPLGWRETTSGTSRFPAWKSDAGTIVLSPRDGKYRFRKSEFKTLDTAKAAAQSDYTARILAAIDAEALGALVDELNVTALLAHLLNDGAVSEGYIAQVEDALASQIAALARLKGGAA